LLHGFTGSARAMACIAEGLGDAHRILAIDLVGHGRSPAPRDPTAYSMTACVGQLAAALDDLNVHDAHWIGYSMGGRAALAFAATHPARVTSQNASNARASKRSWTSGFRNRF
jgi:2-succinyl-6-hydroxy-2,4-cyclohexadiene-1-carboxylate synthase